MTKTLPFSKFQSIYAFFSKFLTDLMDWNVEKGQQGKNVLSSRLFWRVYFSFRFENVLNCQRKWQKPKSFKFSKFLSIFVKVSTVFLDWNVLQCQQKTNCCPVDFNEEIVAKFEWKCFKLTPKMTKNLKFPNFQRFYPFFVEVSTAFLDWTVLKNQKETTRCPVVFNEEIVAMFWLKMSQIDTEINKISKFSNC